MRELEIRHDPAPDTFVEKLRYAPVFLDERPTLFVVAFNLEQCLKPEGVMLLKYMAFFETEEAITEDFKISHFAKANAPAIAYPYLRAFVSQVTSLAGFDCVTLPVKNFASDLKPTRALPGVEAPPPQISSPSE
ncbi:protein-export chaperone SecB [Verrucomicrobium spinosum]|uniref:protein-export chaperone SecB n=1 Tax=Verrucomicrobium spinosum TaxID=2736 RepID=UPI0006A6F5D1|nr:protein-export chaperone SecB [Verrucomicrobium spinosum]